MTASSRIVTGLKWPGVRYFCTTRDGGASRRDWASWNLGLHTGDDPDAVNENRRRLAALLPAEPVWLNQVHGTEVWDADDRASLPGRGDAILPTADAAVTTQRGRPLVIMTADCLPIVMADDRGRVLGVAHAGWRGLAAGVLEATLSSLRARCPDAAGWRAWIGPAIGQACFEVGSDVHRAFVDPDAAAAAFFARQSGRDKWQADLAGLARHRLHGAGVRDIEASGICTYRDETRFFSYRRSPVTGRQATVAWLD